MAETHLHNLRSGIVDTAWGRQNLTQLISQKVSDNGSSDCDINISPCKVYLSSQYCNKIDASFVL